MFETATFNIARYLREGGNEKKSKFQRIHPQKKKSPNSLLRIRIKDDKKRHKNSNKLICFEGFDHRKFYKDAQEKTICNLDPQQDSIGGRKVRLIDLPKPIRSSDCIDRTDTIG